MKQRYFTLYEAAKQMGETHNRVWYRVKTGVVKPAFQQGSHTLLSQKNIDELAAYFKNKPAKKVA